MAHKTPKSRNKYLDALAVMGACIAVASLALVSFEAALLAAGFLVTVGYVANDLRNRRFWETAFSFRIKTLSDKHDSLSQKVTATRTEMLHLRQNIADINRQLREAVEKSEPAAVSQSAAPKMALANDRLPPQPAPRAARPADPRILQATRSGQTPPAQQQSANEEYNDLSDMIVRELVTHAVQEKNIDVFVQPIMRLPQRRVRFYEIYARVRARPGMYLPAKRYMRLAQQEKLSNDIDNQLLMRCLRTIQMSAHVERAAPLFMNINRDTLKNTRFMKELISFLAANRALAPRLVFELPYSHYRTLDSASREIMTGLGLLGCSVSLDHIENFEFNVPELRRHHVRFIKVPTSTLMTHRRTERARAEFQKQKRILESNGISLIAEKVETEADLVEILDFDIGYGQGYLFGRPDLEAAYRKRKAA